MTMGVRPLGGAPLGGLAGTPGVTNFTLQIGPVDVTPLLRVYTYRLRQELNGRDELEFTLISNQASYILDETGNPILDELGNPIPTEDSTGYVPLLGQQVILSIDGGLIFNGSVHERDVEFLSEADSDYTVIQVRCVDLNELADRHIVGEVYENQSAGAIVRAIVAKYLAAELIQIGDVQDGPMVSRVVFSYRTAAACFDELSEQSGMHWNIDQQRTMHFFSRTTAPAPFTITSANAVFRGLRGSRTRNQYRNVQYVDGGHGVTDPRNERFKGDSTLRSFNVEYPVYQKPTITRNFLAQTVGIRGIDTGQQWFWNKGETAIGQGDGDVMAATDFLDVLYQGLYPLLQIVESTASILERQLVEGGTGRYESLDRDDQLDGQALVEEKGMSLLRRYGSLDEVIDFETDVPGLAIGQLVTVLVPELGLDGGFLITHLETQSLLPETRRFRVTATTGELKGTFQDFFARLLTTERPITIREGEVLQEVMALHDLVGVTDSVEATLADFAIGEFGTGEVGTGEFGN